MLSRLLCVGNSSNILLNASQLRTLTWSAVRGARPGVGFNSQRVSKAFGISAQKTGTTLRERLLGPTTGKRLFIFNKNTLIFSISHRHLRTRRRICIRCWCTMLLWSNC